MDIWKKRLLRGMQHAQGYAQLTNRFDSMSMLSMPASLKGSSPGKQAFARAMFIAGLAIALLQACKQYKQTLLKSAAITL
jgi:hypothetical protein